MLTDIQTRTGFAILFTAAVSIISIGACASEPQPRPTALDPSNPAAPESAALPVAVLSPSAVLPTAVAQHTEEGVVEAPKAPSKGAKNGHVHEISASEHDNAKAAEGGKAGKQPVTLYTCPMHPEVISDKPGRCPKCGMKLVPKEPAEGKK
jgi:hypothetical protein